MNRHDIKRKFVIAAAACALASMIVPPSFAGSIDLRLTGAMEAAGPDTRLPVIIRLVGDTHSASNQASPAAAGKLAEKLQGDSAASQGLVRALLNSRGITGIVSLWIINGLAVELTPDQILEISDHPDVESVVLDETITAPATPEADSRTVIGDAWDNLGAVNAPAMWAGGFDGTGVVVAVMDSGVDVRHPDLSGSFRGGANSWYDPHGEHPSPYDATGHGTRTTGILTGGSAGGRPAGVAPGARWIAAKIFSDAGTARYSDIHLGFQWVLDPDGLPDTADAPHIVNNSWGLSDALNQCVAEFQQDVRALRSAGIAVVFSGGNYGPGDATSVSPANYPESFAVGALDETLTAAAANSRGPSACDGGYFPDVTAPGVGIYTTALTSGGAFPDSYALATGSSFAAPHVAGAMALLKDAYPGAAVEELENALTQSAQDLGDPGADDVYGSGLVDAAAAGGMLANPPGCVDGDNDGYFGAGGCGTPVDCDDADPAVSPAAPEDRHDGVDQDCNGYDLTIDVLSAVYLAAEGTLAVEAVSGLGRDAALEVAGVGAMRWDRKKEKWTLTAPAAGGDPGKVTVSGTEGAVVAPTTVDAGSSSGGGKGGGKRNR